MSINARMSEGDPRLYNPSRDVAHNFRQVIEEVARRIDGKKWPAIHKLDNLQDNEMGLAIQSFIKFVLSSVDNPKESEYAALVRCGWFDVSEQSKIAVMAYLGTVITGMYYHGIKEVTLGGQGPLSDIATSASLAAAGAKTASAMAISSWVRPFWRFWQRCRAVRKAMAG